MTMEEMRQSVVVISVANTLGTVFKGKLSRTTTAFIAAMMLTFYAAYSDHPDHWGIRLVLETLAYAVMLFCLSAGAQQSVVAVAERAAGRGAGGVGPASAGRAPSHGWWASWF
jgi:hypothetical protein